MEKRLISLLLLLVFSAACLPQEQWFGKTHTRRTHTLVINNEGEPETLDPQLMSGSVEGRIAIQIFEGLTRCEPGSLRILPGTAASWEIRPGKTEYIFHIRTNARWSNGRPVTASDFVYSWTRLLDPRTAARYAEFLYMIKNARAFHKGILTNASLLGLRATDDHTLLVRLENPAPYFLEATSFYVTLPVPRETVERFGERWIRPEHIVCNGPFRLVSWHMHKEIILEKNPLYWDSEAVDLKRIIALPITDRNTALNLYRTGEVDVLFSLPPELHPYLKTKRDLKSHRGWGVYYYKLNIQKKPLNNRLVRKALALAVNKEQIALVLLARGEVPAYSFTPPFLQTYQPPEMDRFDPERARCLLARAGYPGGKGFPGLSILYNNLEAHRHVAEVIQKNWQQELGIRVELNRQEWKVYLKSTHALEHQIARAGWIGDFNDPMTFLDMFQQTGGNNNTGWSDPQYSRLIATARKTSDWEERTRLLQAAEKILLRDMPVIPIYFYSFNLMAKPYVHGVYANLRDRHPLRNVRIVSWKENRL